MGIPTIASSSDSMDNLTVLDVDNDDIGKTPRAWAALSNDADMRLVEST